MIYQPRNVQPSGSSIDGNIDNTFTMEVQTNSYISAYQLLIVDFNNNNIYTGTKTTLTQNLYNGDILSIPVNASSVKLSNGTNYKWRVRLYQPNSDMLITYGLVQSTSTTTNVYLQPNINIKAGMTLTINSQSKTITSYDVSTGLAVVGSAFSSVPSVGTQYQVYSDFIETIPDYIVYARENPTVSINNVPTSLTLKYHTFQGVYTQSDNVPIVYHQFDLYIKNDNGTNTLVNSSGKVYSANLSYTYDGFRTGNTYLIKLTVENDMGVIVDTDLYTFNVSYDIVEYLQQPLATFNNKNNAVQVSWVTPVENEATSFRSDAARGVVQSDDNTLTSVYLEPGQSISDGDVVQITNSDYSLVLDGKSTQETRSGKNIFNKNSTFKANGATKEVLETGVRSKLINAGNYRYFSVELGKSELLGKTIALTRTITNSAENIGQIALYFGNETTQSKKIIFADKTSGASNIYIPNTFPEDCDRIWILFYGNVAGTGNVGDYTDYTDLMITLGDTLQNYEDYGVMPSPDYPSEIENVKGKNLWDNSNYETNTSSGVEIKDNGFKFVRGEQTGGKYIAKKINVAKGKTYTFSAISSSFGTNDFYICIYRTNIYGTLVKSTIANSLTHTATETEELYFTFIIGSAITEVEASNIQLEVGTAATNYLPYDTIQVKDVGKNLQNTNLRNGIYDANTGKYLTNSNFLANTDIVSVSHNTSYIFSDDLGYSFEAYLYDKNQQFIGRAFATNNKFTTSEETYYINWRTLTAGQNSLNCKVQLEKGTQATTYEPYQENILNIDLQGNELCSIGNVKDELVIENGRAKIIKRTGKVVFNGGESWRLYEKAGSTPRRFGLRDTNVPENLSMISNYFVCKSKLEGWQTDLSLWTQLYYYAITDINSHWADATEFKTWLSTHNTTVYYELAQEQEIDLGEVGTLSPIAGMNNMSIDTSLNTTFSLVYPNKIITGDTWDYTIFNPAGVKQTGVISYYDTATGLGTFSSKQPLTYVPMQEDIYEVISNIYNTSGFLYLYDTPYNTVNSLYTHGYTAAWSASDGLCVLPDDFNITLQFSPDSGFFYDENGTYKERVILVDTEVNGDGNSGRFQIIIDKNKIIFTQQPGISLESSFYTDTTQTFVLTDTGVVQINSDYIWDDTATWNDNYIWTEGGTSIERVCNHWWRVQITNTSIRVEEIFPTQ